MTCSRRHFLHLSIGAATLAVPPHALAAKDYPTRPVRLIVGFSAGGVVDTLARVMGQWLSERLGQLFVIENRPGAGGNLATEAVVRAAPDGHTLLMVNLPHAINAALYGKLNFDFLRDIAPVGAIMRAPGVMVVNPAIPPTSVTEFITYAKANPGKINMASPGNGTTAHVFDELFQFMTGVKMVHVPYRGGAQAITDLLSGQVQVYFGPILESIEHIRAKKLRPLAVTVNSRVATLPDVPVVADFVPGSEASGWHGIGAPANTPKEFIASLNQQVNAALADPDMLMRLIELGGMVLPGSAAEFGKLIDEESLKWGKVVKFAGLKAE
jgi:tripartite-type tricarboxylate transporter receptor subunit TctC